MSIGMIALCCVERVDLGLKYRCLEGIKLLAKLAAAVDSGELETEGDIEVCCERSV